MVFQTSDTTWQAYNTYGGSSFYQGMDNGRAYKLSYNRPFATRAWSDGRDFLFSNEYPMIRFLEQNGYDVSYVSGLDTDLDAKPAHQAQGVPVGRPRRVLVEGPARQRRGRPRRRRQPGVLLRQRGLLEDPLGAVAGRQQHRQPHPGLLQGHLGRHADRPGRRRRPPGVTRGSATSATARRTR